MTLLYALTYVWRYGAAKRVCLSHNCLILTLKNKIIKIFTHEPVNLSRYGISIERIPRNTQSNTRLSGEMTVKAIKIHKTAN